MMTDAEIDIAYRKEKDIRRKEKLHAIWYVVCAKKRYTEVAWLMRRAYNTIKSWHARFLKKGLRGLDDLPRSGRPPKMTNRKLTEFMEKEDVQYKFPVELAKKLKEKFGITYCAGAVRGKLRDGGYSPKVPEPVHARRESVENVAAWQEWAHLWFQEAENDGLMPFVADECSLLHDYWRRRGWWTMVGKRAYGWYNGNHTRRTVFGALSKYGDQMFMSARWFNTESTLQFFRRLLARHGAVALLLDRAAPHRSRAVNDFILDNEEFMRVEYLPTGWPELNPVESCWNTFKRQPHMHQAYPTVDARIKKSMEYLRTHRFNLDIERFLFRKPVAKTF